jgi:hypothetical protein
MPSGGHNHVLSMHPGFPFNSIIIVVTEEVNGSENANLE